MGKLEHNQTLILFSATDPTNSTAAGKLTTLQRVNRLRKLKKANLLELEPGFELRQRWAFFRIIWWKYLLSLYEKV